MTQWYPTLLCGCGDKLCKANSADDVNAGCPVRRHHTRVDVEVKALPGVLSLTLSCSHSPYDLRLSCVILMLCHMSSRSRAARSSGSSTSLISISLHWSTSRFAIS